MNIKFNDYNCFLKIGHYFNHNPSIQLMDADDGMPLVNATIDAKGLHIDEVLIIENSKNKGIYQTLLDAKVIEPFHRQVQAGDFLCPICFLVRK